MISQQFVVIYISSNRFFKEDKPYAKTSFFSELDSHQQDPTSTEPSHRNILSSNAQTVGDGDVKESQTKENEEHSSAGLTGLDSILIQHKEEECRNLAGQSVFKFGKFKSNYGQINRVNNSPNTSKPFKPVKQMKMDQFESAHKKYPSKTSDSCNEPVVNKASVSTDVSENSCGKGAPVLNEQPPLPNLPDNIQLSDIHPSVGYKTEVSSENEELIQSNVKSPTQVSHPVQKNIVDAFKKIRAKQQRLPGIDSSGVDCSTGDLKKDCSDSVIDITHENQTNEGKATLVICNTVYW